MYFNNLTGNSLRIFFFFFIWVQIQPDSNFIRDGEIDRISVLLGNLGLISFPEGLAGKERGP